MNDQKGRQMKGEILGPVLGLMIDFFPSSLSVNIERASRRYCTSFLASLFRPPSFQLCIIPSSIPFLFPHFHSFPIIKIYLPKMHQLAAIFLFFCLLSPTLSRQSFSSSSSADEPTSSEENFIEELSDNPEATGTIWAVLIAGSSGWYNYRHQADVCHAWHALVNHGVNPENIITMMYDDIANNKNNPHPGKLYNNPNGKDVYAGVRIDYKGADVNPKNFMAVLLGDEEAVGGKRVLKSTAADKVFIYFTDHGANGLIGFPDDIMTVKNLSDTLKGMHQKSLYKELTFYLEACESGSMFEKQLVDELEIYAVTAANDHESSWGCYCETQVVPGNCLGDLFSVSWMEDTDKENLRSETLAKQFGIVKRKTTKSHVQNFGNMEIEEEYVAEFMGNKPSNQSMGSGMYSPRDFPMYPARDIPLFLLAHQNGVDSSHKLHILQKKRRYLENQVSHLVKKVLHDPVNQRRALTTYPRQITQLECHHQIMHTFHRFCFNFAKNPYAMKYAFVLTNLCEHRIQPERIKTIMMEHCAGIQIDGIV